MNIKIYTTAWCPYCKMAKKVLLDKNQEFEEIDIEQRNISRDELETITGGRSVPQIIIDEKRIGGYDNLIGLVNTKLLFT